MTEKPLSRHARHRLETKNKLIQAAKKPVLKKGYDSVTIKEITDQAALGYGTFYLHFKDKEDIIWEGIREGVIATQNQVAQQFSSNIPPQVEYYGYLNIFQHVMANQELYRVMLGGKGSSIITSRIQELLAADIINHLQSKSVEFLNSFNLPPEVIAQILTGAISRLVLRWVENLNSYTSKQMAGLMYEALHHKKPPG